MKPKKLSQIFGLQLIRNNFIINIMNIEKKYLELMFNTLSDTPNLSLSEARIRDNFLKSLTEVLKTFYTDRTAIFVKFCDKNEDGTPDIKEDKYTFQPSVSEELGKELDILISETVELDLTPEIKDFIKQTAYKPKIGEAEVIDIILNK